MKSLFQLILLTLFVLSSCAAPEVKVKIVEIPQSDFQTLTYVVQAETTDETCSVENLEFEALIRIAETLTEPSKVIPINEPFGDVPKGKRTRKTFTFNTNGRMAFPEHEIRLIGFGFEKGECDQSNPLLQRQ